MALRAFQIFAAGSHLDSLGRAATFTRQDLAATAAAYGPSKRTAPLVLGHPEDDKPSMGSVRGLVAEGDALFCIADVGDALTRLVQEHRYKYISASFIPPASPRNPRPGVYSLKHVGFLGAAMPAVAGMQPLSFAATAILLDPVADGAAHLNFSYGASPDHARRNEIHLAAQRLASTCRAITYIRAASLIERAVQGRAFGR